MLLVWEKTDIVGYGLVMCCKDGVWLSQFLFVFKAWQAQDSKELFLKLILLRRPSVVENCYEGR
jgi:hypothetical protein